jgi:hypothetical protein
MPNEKGRPLRKKRVNRTLCIVRLQTMKRWQWHPVHGLLLQDPRNRAMEKKTKMPEASKRLLTTLVQWQFNEANHGRFS